MGAISFTGDFTSFTTAVLRTASPRGRGLCHGARSCLPEPPCFAHGKVLVGAGSYIPYRLGDFAISVFIGCSKQKQSSVGFAVPPQETHRQNTLAQNKRSVFATNS